MRSASSPVPLGRRQRSQLEQEARIIGAAGNEFRRSGVRHANIERIADEAGVSRSTVYRRFPSREDLLIAVIHQVRRDLVKEVADTLAGLDPRATVVEAFCLAMTYFRNDELPRRLLGENPEAVDVFVGSADPQVEDMISEFSRGIALTLRSSGASMPDRQLQLAAEVQVRMFISLTTVPSAVLDIGDERQLRAFAEDFLAPMVW